MLSRQALGSSAALVGCIFHQQRKFGVRSSLTRLSSSSLNHRGAMLSEVEMVPIYESMRVDTGDAVGKASSRSEAEPHVREGEDGSPAFGNLMRGDEERDAYVGDEDYRVAWFDYDTHPSLVFLMWAHRRLRELPPEWRNYYRLFLRQEVKSQLYVTTTWDVFIAVVDGYRKAKWILRKFDVPVDESLIPHPYNNFWEVTTPEERAWAYRRSTKMKEAQAVQRVLEGDETADEDLADGDDLPVPALGSIPTTRHIASSQVVSGGGFVDAREHNAGRESITSQTTLGHRLHSSDMRPPTERDIRTSADTYEANSLAMGTIEDDKLWNPVLKNRLYQQRTKQNDDLYAFEDDDEFEKR